MEVSSPTSVLEVCRLDPARLSIAGSCVQLFETRRYGKLHSGVLERGLYRGKSLLHCCVLVCLLMTNLLNVSVLAESVFS